MVQFKFKGTLKDFRAILDRLISKYPKDITLKEMIIKETDGKEDLIVC